MNKDTNLFDELKEMVKLAFPNHQFAGNGREMRINCPICASQGKPDHGYHMYISVVPDSGKPPQYNCFKDSTHRGILTKSFIEQFAEAPQYVDTDLFGEIEKYTKKSSQMNRFRLNSEKRYTLFIPHCQKSINNEIKLGYINKRLGTNLTYEELPDLKIVLNIADFIKANKIQNLTRSPFTVNGLNEYFVGFLSNNNACIRLRRLPNKLPDEYKIIDKRYMNYKTIDSKTEAGYYVIPTQCDILKPIRINIAEGQFDILSVFLNLMNRNRYNNIYAAIGSNSYLQTMSHFLKEYGLINIEFHLYIDNDIPDNTLPNIAKKIKVLGHRIFVHMNMYPNEKDFGVPMSNIKEYCYEL